MSEEDFGLEVLLDYFDAVEAGISQARQRIKERKKLENQGQRPEAWSDRVWSWNPDKIPWTKASGEHGTYERSEDVNNEEFQNLVKDLNAHSNKLTRNDLFYWLFTNGKAVGRKLKQ